MSSQSPLKGKGHDILKSPRKNDRTKIFDFPVAKIKSPVKRSMSELNKLAYKTALNSLHKFGDDEDEINKDDHTLINEIIKLSKLDGLPPLTMEEYEIEIQQDTDKQRNERKATSIENTPKKINDATVLNSETRSVSIPKLKMKEEPKLELIEDPVKEEQSDTPVVSPLKSLKGENPNLTPTSSPFKSSPLKSDLGSPSLRRSTRQKVSILDKLQNASTESSPSTSPRKRNRRNLHDNFNKSTYLTPKSHQNIKLMKVPDMAADDDILLMADAKERHKVLYHDGYEAFFEQNQTRGRLSKSSMTMAPDITYEDFNRYNKLQDLLCSEPIQSLNKLYEFQFTQWQFELQEGFNLMFYGIGSKRKLLIDFMQRFLLPMNKRAKCIVVNGYNTEFNLRLLMREIWRVCFNQPVPSKSREMRETCNLTHLEFMKVKNENKQLFILLHNIDGEALRNDDLQYLLSQIARIKQVSLICSADNLNTPLFWDASILSNFNFIWHNVSTYQNYQTEISFKDPLSIGKTDEIVGSRGAKYVLSSLTGNAKNLYKHLILQQLEKIDLYIDEDTKLLEHRGSIKGLPKTSIPLRDFYELCVNEFIISNDISFRTILGEFIEHKMCNLTRDNAGTEILYVSFTVDEMEKLLDEELMD